MAYLSVPKIFRHLTFLHLSSPFIVDNCSHISNLSFAITYIFSELFVPIVEINSPYGYNINIKKLPIPQRRDFMIEQLIAEATECDFKVALEIKKPKSWLKSVSAFSNGIGGTLFFGISDDRKPIGLSDVQKDAEAISRLIKERITPLPQFILKPL